MTTPDFDMNALIAQAQEMQQKLQEAQQQLTATTVTGQAYGGKVQIDMLGSGEVTDCRIDPNFLNEEGADLATLEDLIVGAAHDAFEKLSELARQTVGPVTGDLGANPLEADLGKLLGGE